MLINVHHAYLLTFLAAGFVYCLLRHCGLKVTSHTHQEVHITTITRDYHYLLHLVQNNACTYYYAEICMSFTIDS